MVFPVCHRFYQLRIKSMKTFFFIFYVVSYTRILLQKSESMAFYLLLAPSSLSPPVYSPPPSPRPQRLFCLPALSLLLITLPPQGTW